MANHRTIITFENMQELYFLFEMIEPNKLPEKIAQIESYLNEAYLSDSKDNRIKKMEVSGHTALVRLFKCCAENMLKKSGSRFFSLHLECGTVINLEALFEFLDSLECVNDTVDDLEELDRVLKNYANETNVWQFKECSQTLSALLVLMKDIQRFCLPKAA